MTQSFGVQTLTILAVSLGAADRLGVKAVSTVSTAVVGCRVRVLEQSEKTSDTDVIRTAIKATLPPVAAALAVDERDRCVFDGDTYLITKVKQHPFKAQSGVHHVTVVAEKWTA